MTDTLRIVKEDVRLTHIWPMHKEQTWWERDHLDNWGQRAGVTDYKLWTYLAQQFNGATFLDIGTYMGGSAICLASNPSNKVISWDIVRFPTHDHLNKPNIELRIGNFMEATDLPYDDIPLILLDVDPHDGLQEPPMIDYLVNIGWSGVILMDDIGGMFPGLRKAWEEIPYEKYELTDIGHHSGSGLVNIGDRFKIDIVE